MSNQSYLCGTALETTYPSFVDPAYDPDRQTIAADVYCVPLLWTALFRPADIVTKTFTVEGDQIVTEAPLARREVALRQLREALPYLNKLYAAEGKLDEYAAFLEQALAAVDFPFVTIELQEIAALAESEQAYYDNFRAALAAIGGDASPAAKERLTEIAQFDNLVRFPPARLLLDELEGEDNDFWNHCRVCGAGVSQTGMGRAVPWEPE